MVDGDDAIALFLMERRQNVLLSFWAWMHLLSGELLLGARLVGHRDG